MNTYHVLAYDDVSEDAPVAITYVVSAQDAHDALTVLDEGGHATKHCRLEPHGLVYQSPDSRSRMVVAFYEGLRMLKAG